jgi:O-antigen/teichoic acid export membrane protein
MFSTRAALWRDRSLRFALGGAAPVVTALFALVRNKWLAEHLATAGLGVLGQVFSTQTLLGTAAGLGLSLPVARALGAAAAAGDARAARRAVWTALALVGAASLAIVLTILVFAPALSQALLGTPQYAPLLRIVTVGIAGLAFHAVANGVFAGRSDVGGPLAVALGGGAVAVAVTVALVPRAGLTGGAIGAAMMVPAGLVAAWWARSALRDAVLSDGLRPDIDRATARALIRVGLAALALAVVDQGTLLALRAHYLRQNGVPANGLLQAALAIAQQVSGVFHAYLASYAFGRVSAAAGIEGMRDHSRRFFAALSLVATAAFALAMWIAGPLLLLLYSDAFAAARPLMAWTLFAEFCKVLALTWGLAALPAGGLRSWMSIGLAGPVTFVPAYALLARGAGEMALPAAAALAALVQLGVSGLVMSRLGVTLRARELTLLFAGLATLALLARLTAGWPA